jgi:hypothetical protein
MRGKNEMSEKTDLGELDTDEDDGACSEVEPATSLVTTSQAARIAGVSASTIIRNRAVLGAIPGPNGIFLFNTEVVRQKTTIIRKRQVVSASGPTDGEVAAAVFAALKAGKHPPDIVIELRLAPDTVIELKRLYEEMNEVPKTMGKCRCGSGQFACFCRECVIVLDLATIERRIGASGKEEVRLYSQIKWGRRVPKRPGQFSEFAMIDMYSEWVLADSEDGRDLLEAQHASRPRR